MAFFTCLEEMKLRVTQLQCHFSMGPPTRKNSCSGILITMQFVGQSWSGLYLLSKGLPSTTSKPSVEGALKDSCKVEVLMVMNALWKMCVHVSNCNNQLVMDEDNVALEGKCCS